MDDLHDQDESERIAVSALGDMRNNALRADPGPSSSDSSPFVSRVSHIPLVNSALSLYEQGKASSRVVKYGAEMMESSVKTISRPVIDRLPVNVNQLDEFACRQLDRFDRYRRPSTSTTSPPTSPTSNQPISSNSNQNGSAPLESPNPGLPKVKLKSEPETDNEAGTQRAPKGRKASWIQASSPFVGPAPPPPPELAPSSSSSSRTQTQTHAQTEERQVAQRSRWQAVLLEAGGLSAALSEESLRRLKYCLEWLQYATAHIDAQILILRDFTASLQHTPARTPHPPISQAHMRTLVAVRRDIVHTVKQVVDVVSKYAGGALPEPARTRVRGFILELPQRWAQKVGTPGREDGVERERERERDRDGASPEASGSGGPVRRTNRRGRERTAGGAGSAPSSRATSPMARHTRPQHPHAHGQQDEGGEPVSAGTAMVAAQRILTLATESLDMMRGVTGVVRDSLDRADAWVGRFRTVGLQRGERPEDATSTRISASSPSNDADTDAELDFTTLGLRHRHRRDSSFGSDTMSTPYFGASASTSSSMSLSSYTGTGGSVPSTPGAGSHTPGYVHGYGYGGSGSGSGAGLGAGSGAGVPIGLGLSSMTIREGGGSRYGTPKSVAGLLLDEAEAQSEGEGEGDEGLAISKDRAKAKGRTGAGAGAGENDEVKIVGMDVEAEPEDGTVGVQVRGQGEMDVDA